MHNELTQLLKSALNELGSDGDQAIQDSLAIAANLLLGSESLFERIPRMVYGWEHNGNEVMPFPLHEEPVDKEPTQLEFFPERGILLHDGLHASAHGGTRFMYRAKGNRLYLLENGYIMPISIYAHVDRQGLFIQNDYVADLAINVRSLAGLERVWASAPFDLLLGNVNVEEMPRFISQDLIKILCNIREPFKRDFLFEHLLTPPDVDTPSEFSLQVRTLMWDICLSSSFRDQIGAQEQYKCMNILSSAEVSPAPEQIVEYVRELSRSDIDMSEIMERLNQMQTSISGKIDKLEEKLTSHHFWLTLFADLDEPSRHGAPRSSTLTDIKDVEAVVLLIVDQFKHLVEHNGLWKELWDANDHPRAEKSAQNLFFLMAHSYCKAYDIDLTPEANLGNGPVDFKMSRGYRAKILVEIKLSTNTNLVHGYEEQLAIYKKADETGFGVFLVIDVGGLGTKLNKVNKLAVDAQQANEPVSHVRYVNALRKASASKR